MTQFEISSGEEENGRDYKAEKMEEIKEKVAAKMAKMMTTKVSEDYIFDREMTAELDELCLNEGIDESIFREYATEVKKLDKEKLMDMI